MKLIELTRGFLTSDAAVAILRSRPGLTHSILGFSQSGFHHIEPALRNPLV
jgi:hypothetical protein